ncbi:glycosyl hydrolase 115 family protein [Pedobacter glucosidilyticus]|uniref:glycosyl hydrolase 115 family protein n=1 Tax=Pedobacter glucosidilyticus TaxID=1122941 RepID=UPI0026ED6124|nr:glycosyl hydrolase 115 family protein [Pedobacter glucosidilyticus]
MKKIILTITCVFSVVFCLASGLDKIVNRNYTKGSFSIANNGKVAHIIISENDFIGVKRAAKDLQTDIFKVTGKTPELLIDKKSTLPIIIGTIGQSTIIDKMIKHNNINVAGIAGQWESTLIEVVKNPLPGIDSALVIAGSDKRGTIYGIYEISYQIGVSPWYYWADVPVKTSQQLFVIAGRHVISSPAVQYRGIFLNDEAPALSGWSKKQFGGFNHQFYEKVFKLILRLKGNYLWPAMWGSAFNDDDPINPVKADEYGIVMGTSHHEPLMRAHDEWRRYGSGKWNYETNTAKLQSFWEDGFKRTLGKEQIVTIGMRGDGDEPMTEGTAIDLLERIVKDQRAIIEKVSGKAASATPQLWALYKEVQDYYDKGMRVPDDVTLLLCDDNWGNIRKLPKLNEQPRSGGYGIYYHFDYVGGPRNYKWINTNPIQKIWEQMNLAYEHDANKIWIVNVGDLKPMEFPIEFFLDYAWAPDAIPAEKLKEYGIKWATKQFGDSYAIEIAELIELYSKYNGRVKPELLDANTYSLTHYNEFETVTQDYQNLAKRALELYKNISATQKDAYYQLVLHPVTASANLYELYFTVAKNRLYAKQGRNTTNTLAKEAKKLFEKDAAISKFYNDTLAGGKWKHMMDQTHIGYTYWQQPPVDKIPDTQEITIQEKAQLGIAIEGSLKSWAGKTTVDEPFPVFNFYTKQKHFIELFNKGTKSVNYKIKTPNFIKASVVNGRLETQERIYLEVDYTKLPITKINTSVIISGNDNSKITLPIIIDNTRFKDEKITGFVEQDGYVAIEAVHFTKAINKRPIFWKEIKNYGKTSGGMIAVPVTSETQTLDKNTPHLAFDIYLKNTGNFTLNAYISPTINFTHTDGLKFALSIDDGEPVIVNISKDDQDNKAWEKSVAESIKIFKIPFNISQNGKHTLKYWMISPGVVLQKLVLDTGGLKPSFLGPKETFINHK